MPIVNREHGRPDLTGDQSGRMAKVPGKFDTGAECMRMTSLSCASEPQSVALLLLQADDLRGFTDLINVVDVEQGGDDVRHWINLPAGEGGAK